MEKTLVKTGTMQVIACEDIGWFAANALLHPQDWVGKTLDIAGDDVTYAQMHVAFRKALGKNPKKSAISRILFPLLMPEKGKMFKWYREPRFKADIGQLRKIHPGFMRLEDYFNSLKGD